LSLVQRESDFQRHLPVINLAIFNLAAGLDHFKPAHISDGLACPIQGILNRRFHTLRRGPYQFDLFVNVLAHAPIIPSTTGEHNKNGSIQGKSDPRRESVHRRIARPALALQFASA
jgi:hypothetical protein